MKLWILSAYGNELLAPRERKTLFVYIRAVINRRQPTGDGETKRRIERLHDDGQKNPSYTLD